MDENLNQAEEKRIEPKIRVSRDGKWIIMNVPGIEQAVIKPVNYFKAIIEASEKRIKDVAAKAGQIKG